MGQKKKHQECSNSPQLHFFDWLSKGVGSLFGGILGHLTEALLEFPKHRVGHRYGVHPQY